jgi:myo-inositol-1-phosphate synthase
MNKIKVAIVGIGNCASSLIQGIHYYGNKTSDDAKDGILTSPSAYFCIHPPKQFTDDEAYRMTEAFIQEKFNR